MKKYDIEVKSKWYDRLWLPRRAIWLTLRRRPKSRWRGSISKRNVRRKSFVSRLIRPESRVPSKTHPVRMSKTSAPGLKHGSLRIWERIGFLVRKRRVMQTTTTTSRRQSFSKNRSPIVMDGNGTSACWMRRERADKRREKNENPSVYWSTLLVGRIKSRTGKYHETCGTEAKTRYYNDTDKKD